MDSLVDPKSGDANRFPTRQEFFLVFSACIFPIHSWLLLVFLFHFPALIVKATAWQILGVFAYSLSFALLESLCLFGFLTILLVILPIKFFRDRFVYFGTNLALILAGWAVIISFQGETVENWRLLPLALVVLIIFIYIIWRPENALRTRTIADRLTIISSIYIFIDILCIVIVLIRNFTGLTL